MPTSEFELFPSPLRYPGGKGKIANFLKLLFLENSFVNYQYVEPFAGGASVALTLLYEEYADSVWINDLDAGIYAFWKYVLNDPDGICDRIQHVSVDMDTWQEQRSIHERAVATDDIGIDLAFATFFLNRTNRSGIIRGGPIGGWEQKGKWRLDARFNREDMCRRIRKVSRFRSRISVSRFDAEDLLDRLDDGTHERFVYLDPPYFGKGSELYSNWYADEDHAALARKISGFGGPWLVTYDRVEEVCRLYKEERSLDYELRYSAQDRYLGSEIMFVSRELRLPNVTGPTKISASVVNEARLAAQVA